MTFRGTKTLALMCREPGCEREAELLALNDEFVCCPRSEWCDPHYAGAKAADSRRSTDLVYRLVKEP
jgi:hypothetical protein